MVTPAPARRIASAAVALAFAGPAVLLGGVAWAEDPTPAPVDDSATEAPVVQPSIGSWIIGGTLLEGSTATPAKPAAKPAAKPVVKPAAQPAAPTRATTRTKTSRATAPDGATALPFTGDRADALLPIGVTLVVGGVVLTLAARPRRVSA